MNPLRHAADLLAKRAAEATPGPWERPLDTQRKNLIIAPLPPGEQGRWAGGDVPAGFARMKGPLGRYAGQRERIAVLTAGTGRFCRSRSGRDLEYAALMNPRVGAALATMLTSAADKWDTGVTTEKDGRVFHDGGCTGRIGGCNDDDPPCRCFDDITAIAGAILGITITATGEHP